MSFTVVIPISNTSSRPQKVSIPKGTLVQVNAHGCQNVVIAKPVVQIVPPGQTVHVKAEALCANQTLTPPHGTPANLTGWTFPRTFSSQAHVWGTLAAPAAVPNPATMPSVVAGVTVEQAQKAICAAFDYNSLQQMLRLRLSLRLEDLVDRGKMLDVAFDLLEVAERSGWQKELIREAYKYNAAQSPTNVGHPDLCAVYQQFGFDVTANGQPV